MKMIGFLMIAAGFILGALISVVNVEHVAWDWFALSLVTGLAGVVLVRLSHRRAGGGRDTLAANVRQLADVLERVITRTEQLVGTETYEVRHRIDSLIAADLDTFATDRYSIGRVFGLTVYADVMGHFAAGERYLNRVWSASADGYVDEVAACLNRSREEFEAALRLLRNACTENDAIAAVSPAIQ